MKAFAIQAPFGIDALTATDHPNPTPGPGQVVVQVKAVSLNFRDLLTVSRGPLHPISKPLIPLSDGAGEVIAVGEGVTRVKPGHRVTGIFFQTWLAGDINAAHFQAALGGTCDGMFAEQVALSEEGIVHIPDSLSFEEAATLPCAAVTAWQALVPKGNLKAGDTVLVLGTGGVSIAALQLALLQGARVIVTSSSDEKLARAQQLGATDLINYKTTPDWDKQVLKMTGGAGVDHVIEVGGAGTLEKSLQAVRVGGTVSLIGILSGFDGRINPMAVLMKGVRLQGIYVGSREMFEAMNRAITVSKMRPVIDRVFPATEARAAFTYMESAAHFGKIVITL